jgi:hypothetical protein
MILSPSQCGFCRLFAATAAYGDHIGPIREIHVEFFFEGSRNSSLRISLDELCKGRSVTDLTQRKAARPVYSGIIIMYRRARVGLHKFRTIKNSNGSRVSGVAEPLQIQHRKHGRRYTNRSGFARLNPFQRIVAGSCWRSHYNGGA